jgi:3-hydroxymyristoyl/3-hydroxydecanoyl-(acyl carrier protein) dehydratase
VFASDGEHAAQTAWVFPQTFTGFRGHFIGNPICPGVCLVAAQLEASRRLVGARRDLLEMENVKFTWPVFPDRQVDGRLKVVPLGDRRWRVQADLTRGERRIAKFLLLVREIENGGEL